MRTRKKRKIGRKLRETKRFVKGSKREKENIVDSEKIRTKREKTEEEEENKYKQKMVHTENNEKKKDNKEVKKKRCRREIFHFICLFTNREIQKDMTNQDTQGISKT